MTVKEFLEGYNYAPYDLEEIAGLMKDITDSPDLAGAAMSFLETKENLELMLDNIGFEFG